MGPGCALAFVLFVSTQHASCFSGDPVMYLPPFEVRTMRGGGQPGFAPSQQYMPHRGPMPQMQPQIQPLAHTSPPPPPLPHSTKRLDKEKTDTKNFTVSELLNALNHLEDKEQHQDGVDKNERTELSRSAYDYPQPYGYRPPAYGYQQQQPSYGPYGYHESPHAPPPEGHHSASKISLLKPDLGDLVKPVTTKVAGKVSGLIGLVLALLTGSAPNDLELKGFKDIIINGIVKPLLVAKGGIKSLISKLTIPVISLLLINLEVLITIWWLWEDCPEQTTPPPYSYPKPYEYPSNTYR